MTEASWLDIEGAIDALEGAITEHSRVAFAEGAVDLEEAIDAREQTLIARAALLTAIERANRVALRDIRFALSRLHSAVDKEVMGDTDSDNDESELMQAMQVAARFCGDCYEDERREYEAQLVNDMSPEEAWWQPMTIPPNGLPPILRVSERMREIVLRFDVNLGKAARLQAQGRPHGRVLDAASRAKAELLSEIANLEAAANGDEGMLVTDVACVSSAVNTAMGIIGLGDQRLLACDGPAGGQPPDISLAEWRRMYVSLEKGRKILDAHLESVTPR